MFFVRQCTLSITIIALLTPGIASAAILINEIAWMGTDASSHDEWIELRNTSGSSVALDGWELHDNGSLTISLSGTIPANGYALLERTDDESVPGKSALVTYTGALSNGGATLTLQNGDGGTEDRVAGGSEWSAVGGDNDAKETAQRTDAGWITAAPTPKAVNAAADVGTEQDPEEEKSETQTQDEEPKDPEPASKGQDRTRAKSEKELSVDITADARAYVNQPVTLEAHPSGIAERLIAYDWNFGDGHTGHGKETSHVYTYPGEYVVVAYAEHRGYEADAEVTITVLPTSNIEIDRGRDGALLIHNDAQYRVDVSNFTVVDGGDSFTLPAGTALLAGATLMLAPEMLSTAVFSNDTYVLDAAGDYLADMSPDEKVVVDSAPHGTAAAETSVAPVAQAHTPVTETSTPQKTTSGTVSLAEDIDDDRWFEVNTERLPFAGLILLIGLGMLVVYARAGHRN